MAMQIELFAQLPLHDHLKQSDFAEGVSKLEAISIIIPPNWILQIELNEPKQML